MNRMLKKLLWALLIVAGIGVILILSLVLWLMFSMDWSAKRAKVDYALQTEVCDSMRMVTDSVSLYLKDIDGSSRLEFSLIRNDRVVTEKTVFTREPGSVTIPFCDFYRTDTILLVVQNESAYFISGFRYEPYLGYGMFGYVGFKECRLSEDMTVNGNSHSRFLRKEDSIPVDSIPAGFRQ